MALTFSDNATADRFTPAALARTASQIEDASDFAPWVRQYLNAYLPHQALLCGQSVAHAGGYASQQLHSVGLSPVYLAGITCHGNNVRSPIFTHLLRAPGTPQFFDAQRDADTVPANWLAPFCAAGLTNVVGLTHVDGQGDDAVLTMAGFYNVHPALERKAIALQAVVMPVLHVVLTNMLARANARCANATLLTAAERALVPLLRRGLSAKAMARTLSKSHRTVEDQIAILKRKLRADNRIDLISKLAAQVKT